MCTQWQKLDSVPQSNYNRLPLIKYKYRLKYANWKTNLPYHFEIQSIQRLWAIQCYYTSLVDLRKCCGKITTSSIRHHFRVLPHRPSHSRRALGQKRTELYIGTKGLITHLNKQSKIIPFEMWCCWMCANTIDRTWALKLTSNIFNQAA